MAAHVEQSYGVWCNDCGVCVAGGFDAYSDAEEARDGHNAEMHPEAPA